MAECRSPVHEVVELSKFRSVQGRFEHVINPDLIALFLVSLSRIKVLIRETVFTNESLRAIS